MKIKLTLLFFGLMAASVFAAETSPEHLSVAVYDFKGDAEVVNFGSKVTALVTADLANRTNLIMVERAELEKAISEQAFGASGMVSSDAAAKIGLMTGAKVLVSGQVIKLSHDRITVVANIIGTETGRLFAAKVEGSSDQLMELTSDLGAKISKIIGAETTNLIAPTEESHTQRLNRIVESIKGTNRPSVSVEITFYSDGGGHWRDNRADYEFSAVLLKAGFTVLDDNSESKPDIQIIGDASNSYGTPRGEMVSTHTAIEVKIQERRTGKILAFDRQESAATGIGKNVTSRLSHVNAVDELCARLLPVMTK